MYLGNYPNMANYNDNIPIGFWHWDIEDSEEIEEEENIPLENDEMEDE